VAMTQQSTKERMSVIFMEIRFTKYKNVDSKIWHSFNYHDIAARFFLTIDASLLSYNKCILLIIQSLHSSLT
ncbi:MAG TPA: hypothetical protein PLW09_08625, partial [Candidatus Kapabacteria bacterium]|nr:hypothetical protein [Candidatus Kapabacteria bacterium]